MSNDNEKAPMTPPSLLYKVLQKGCSRGSYKWSLPKKSGDTWAPGDWHEVEGEIVQCRNGLHFTTDPVQRMGHGDRNNPEIYVVETEGDLVHDIRRGQDEWVARKARLVRRLSWEELGALGLVDLETTAPAGPFYKVLYGGKTDRVGDEKKWALPERVNGRWKPGAWMSVKASRQLVFGHRGFHIRTTLKGLGRFDPYETPEVYLVEARGKVVIPKADGGQRMREIVAREVRLVRPLTWAEMRKAGLVVGPKVYQNGDSKVMACLRLLARSGRGLSVRQAGYGVRAAIRAAVRMRVPFEREDFKSIDHAKGIVHWYGDSGIEQMYAFLIGEKHESALRSFEHWKGRKPFIIRGTRVHLGSAFQWRVKGRKRPEQFRVTSFDDKAGTMTCVVYKSEWRKVSWSNGHEWRETIGRRVTFTHAEIDEAEKSRVFHVRLEKDAERIADALKGYSYIDLNKYQIVTWTAEQRTEAMAYVQACKDKEWGKPYPPPPAFIAAAVAERKRMEQRVQIERSLQKKLWAKGDKRGAEYDWEIKVTEGEIDAEEQRLAEEAKPEASAA